MLTLSPKEAVIEAGEKYRDAFIVKSGLVATTYIDEGMEKVDAFAQPGTFFMSLSTVRFGAESLFRYEAATPAQVIRIPRRYAAFSPLLPFPCGYDRSAVLP